MKTKRLGASLCAVALSITAFGQTPMDPPKNGELRAVPNTKWSSNLIKDQIGVEPHFGSTYDAIIHGLNQHVGNPNEVDKTWTTAFKPSGLNEAPVTMDTINIAAPALLQGFEGIGQTNLTPPDTHAAFYKDYGIVTVNARWRITDKLGRNLFETGAGDFFGDPSGFYFDPKVIFDPWNARWVILWHFVNNGTKDSRLVVMVSDDDNPFGNWWWYYFPANTGSGSSLASCDYFDLGFGPNGIYAGGNQFKYTGGFAGAVLHSWNKTEIYNAQTAFQVVDGYLVNPDGSATQTPRVASLQNSWGGPDICFVNARDGGGNKITLWSLSDPFGAHTLTKKDIAVSDYDLPPDALQPNNSALDTINCRLYNAIITRDAANNRYLYTGNNDAFQWGGGDGTRVIVHNYAIDPVAGTLRFQNLFGNPGFYYWYPNAGSDYDGNALITFSRSANPPNSTFAEHRYYDVYPNGTNGGSGLIHAGAGNYSGFRWGDYHQSSLDWGDYYGGSPKYKIWMYGEYATSSNTWGTSVGASTFATNPGFMSVTPSGGWQFTGYRGGPFSPANGTYTVSNPGQTGINFDVLGAPSWLNVDTGYFELAGGGARNVNFGPNATANSLAFGIYNDSLQFLTYNNATVNRAGSIVVKDILEPESVKFFRGSYVSGALSDMFTSNNVRYIAKNGLIINSSESPITMDVFTTGPVASVGTMNLIFEAQVSSTGLTQTVQMYDYTQSKFVTLDVRGATLSDQSINLAVANPNRYIRVGDNQINIRILVKQTGPTTSSNWQLRTDRLVLDVSP